MELSKEKVGDILTKASEQGLSLKVRDISYVLLRRYFADRSYAFRVCFGADADYGDSVIDAYENGEGYAFLKEELEMVRDRSAMVYSGGAGVLDDITFEENKAYMLKLKKETEEAMERGEVDKKDGLKILSDITTRLNDKFAVTAQQQDQLVVVNCKYDHICPVCQTEVARRPMTKDEAMREYNLIEKK